MVTGRHLVVVDGIPETEQVVRAVFEPRGMQVTRLVPSDDEPCHRPQPCAVVDLVIIDEDGSPEQTTRPRAMWSESYRVVIGSGRYPANETVGQQYLRKPFQYAELIGAIERLLATEVEPASDAD
ncbi:MAG: hypothetical protein ABGZ17_32380 [Planctomycetaceae bacterium]